MRTPTSRRSSLRDAPLADLQVRSLHPRAYLHPPKYAANHSEGKWRLVPHSDRVCFTIEAGGGKPICNVVGAGVENKANAQLIAAAPELLRLAKLCERHLPITKWKSLNIQLQAAIAGVESREDRA